MIPTMVIGQGAIALATSGNTETFCGGYLNQLVGQAVSGSVIGIFVYHCLSVK